MNKYTLARQKIQDYEITNKSGGSTTGSGATSTCSGSGGGGDDERAPSNSGVFVYSMAKTSLGAGILLSPTWFYQNNETVQSLQMFGKQNNTIQYNICKTNK